MQMQTEQLEATNFLIDGHVTALVSPSTFQAQLLPNPAPVSDAHPSLPFRVLPISFIERRFADVQGSLGHDGQKRWLTHAAQERTAH